MDKSRCVASGEWRVEQGQSDDSREQWDCDNGLKPGATLLRSLRLIKRAAPAHAFKVNATYFLGNQDVPPKLGEEVTKSA